MRSVLDVSCTVLVAATVRLGLRESHMKTIRVSLAGILLVLLLVAAWLPQAQPAQAADLEALVRLYYQAVDRGDTPAALAGFTDDAAYVFGACSPLLPCTGKAEIQAAIQGGVGIKNSYGVLSSSVSASTVTARVEQ